jgi:hypothetical protein
VLLKLAYLSVSSEFATLRLLPTSDRDKDAEILALRHQITLLERQLSGSESCSIRGTGFSWQPCCTTSRIRRCAGYDCWYARTRYCAGTGTR